MLNKKEMIAVISITLVLGIVASISHRTEVWNWEIFGITTGLILAVLLINTIAKKVTGFYLDTEVEIKQWEFSRYGIKKHKHFKKPVPAGILAPLIIKFFSIGFLNWMACLTFDVKGKTYRAAKRHGIYSFSEISEKEIGWMATAGIWANIIFAIVGYLIGGEVFLQFARLNIGYAFFNLIPISDLDGSKIFFGNKLNWSFLAIIVSMAVLGALMIV
jgi:Zn-dependent protease